MDLTTLRLDINSIDESIVSLLNRRFEIALKIGTLKSAQNIPVYNEAREQEVLDLIRKKNPGPLADNQLTQIFQTIIDVCRKAQIQSRKD
ncbi:chorismate mutase [candidate division KSB1 bacterium]|nr:chorismate mutase [candidate division KSB1 bacterium]